MENPVLPPPEEHPFQQIATKLQALRKYLPKGYAADVIKTLASQGYAYEVSLVYKVMAGKIYNPHIVQAVLDRANQEKNRLIELDAQIKKLTEE
jgi:hypothetical protein